MPNKVREAVIFSCMKGRKAKGTYPRVVQRSNELTKTIIERWEAIPKIGR